MGEEYKLSNERAKDDYQVETRPTVGQEAPSDSIHTNDTLSGFGKEPKMLLVPLDTGGGLQKHMTYFGNSLFRDLILHMPLDY